MLKGFSMSRAVLLAGPFLVALGAWYGITVVHHDASERRRARSEVARIETTATRQDAIESALLQLGLVLGEGPETTLATATDGMTAEMEDLRREGQSRFVRLDSLAGEEPEYRRLQDDWLNFQRHMAVELRLLEEDRFSEAFRYGREALAPRFTILENQFDVAGRSFLRSAEAAEQRADAGTLLVLMVAALLLFLMQRQRARRAREMAHRALHDPLTDLGNRALLWDRIGHALARLERQGGTHALLLLDVDDFKSVNDSLGHDVGDAVLVEIAARLQQTLRSGDTIGRLGGDEFAVLIEDVESKADVNAAIRRLAIAMSAPFENDGRFVTVTVSIGVTFCVAGDTVEQTLGDADVAMYSAKFEEKGTCQLYDPRMRQAIVKRKDLEADLRIAVKEEQFLLQYQPIIDVVSSRIVGIEALIRWMHPTRGLVPPNDFIPLVEQTNLIGEVGVWVLRTSCAQLRDLRKTFPNLHDLRLCVNISAKQLMAGSFVDEVRATLEEEGLDHSQLILEVTEGTLMRDTEATIEKLTHLRDLGVRLAVDDFGTGYSSLSYLRRFPLDIIKIDRSFIDGIERDAEAAALVKGIIHMAEALKLDTVAEGIETQDQLECLRALGCLEGQGFYVARPLDPEVLELLLKRDAMGAFSVDSMEALA